VFADSIACLSDLASLVVTNNSEAVAVSDLAAAAIVTS